MPDSTHKSLNLARPEHLNEEIERHLDALQDHLEYQDGESARDHGALCIALAQMLAITIFQATEKGDELRQAHQTTAYVHGVVAAMCGDEKARAVVEMGTTLMESAARAVGTKAH